MLPSTPQRPNRHYNNATPYLEAYIPKSTNLTAMANYETAVDQSIKVGDITFTYRQLGQAHGVPLVLLMGFRCVRTQILNQTTPTLSKAGTDLDTLGGQWTVGTQH